MYSFRDRRHNLKAFSREHIIICNDYSFESLNLGEEIDDNVCDNLLEPVVKFNRTRDIQVCVLTCLPAREGRFQY
jgi:hypothetical protein